MEGLLIILTLLLYEGPTNMPGTISRHFTHLIFKFLEEGRWNYAHVQKKK